MARNTHIGASKRRIRRGRLARNTHVAAPDTIPPSVSTPSSAVHDARTDGPSEKEGKKKMERLLTRHEVEWLTGLSRSSIYRLMRDDRFPHPKRVGLRAVRWRESEILAWIASRPLAIGTAAA